MTATLDPTRLLTDWGRWHHDRERELAAPHGWLSLVDLRWLTTEPVTTPALPGRFSLTADGRARYDGAGENAITTADGSPVDGPVTADAAEGGGFVWLRAGTVAVELIRRSERLAVRFRDSDAPGRTRFTGVPAYEVRPEWLVDGVFRPEPPHQIVVGAAAAGLAHVQTVVGTVEFAIDGVGQRLRAVAAGAGRAQLVFHDPTNGAGTAPWRTLTVDITDGPVVLDFNRAVNPPFAFSDFGTCPRPAEGNVITRPVTAGERVPVRADRA